MLAREMLKAWRGSRSPQEAAGLLGCHVTSIEKWETGKRRPDGDMRIVLERVTGIAASAWVPEPSLPPAEPSAQP